VPPDLYERVELPSISKADQVSDSTISPERVPNILNYLSTYEYASRDHVVWSLVWHTGMRSGGLRSLDLEDTYLNDKEPYVELHHRPKEGTPLKNQLDGERVNRISRRVANILQDYIDGPREDVVDDYGRSPLVTTQFGRVTAGSVRDTFYRWTRPCQIGKECPHDRDPETCEATLFDKMSTCPSARSPHDARKARVTKYRNDGVPRAAVSDRLDASEDILDKHYDRASKREKADRRWRFFQE